MGVTVVDWFGYRPDDGSMTAAIDAERMYCPFIRKTCEKVPKDGTPSGVCALKQTTMDPVVCCPNRMYGDDYRILRDVAVRAFGDGLSLVNGREAQARALATGSRVVGVFGKKWGGEVHLPQRKGAGSYFVDWILAVVSPSGLEEFVAIEVQTIDTTGNYHDSLDALRDGRRKVESKAAGFNWENVNKRILSQLIYKGNLLQREPKCRGGLYFVTPRGVYNKIMDRLIGTGQPLPDYPQSAGSITFLSYDPDWANAVDGAPAALVATGSLTTTIAQVSLALNSPTNLPPMGVYADSIEAAFQ
ncbi:hypothetical protein KZC52_09605 [Microbacterium sp. kSW2-24]|uniref:NotI family restriction endonuclease n=1 Tax=Microbacterium galbinum TaxID=2851646 RepID=UPI001FFD6729|nr:NotI family restriction endonuclease [Microbacterium galbinum]MCK2023178.1 hypothetical protein [Microbacterium galbinum]